MFLPVLHTSFLIIVNLNGQVVFWWLENKERRTMEDCLLVDGMDALVLLGGCLLRTHFLSFANCRLIC
jgi:hypothetical protein